MTNNKGGLTFVGDIAFTGIISSQPELNKVRFEKILPLFPSNEMIFANLEVPLKTGEFKNEHKKLIHFSLEGPTKELLKSFSIRCVSLANNHIYDYKMPGLKATINLLNQLGIKHTGAGWLPEHTHPVFIEAPNTKIGFLAYVDRSTNPKTELYPELLINYFDLNSVIQDIKAIRNCVQKVIVSIHWGVDYSFYPTPRQIETAHCLIDEGADIIMGHHPHTIQPFEKYNDGLIFYSLGSLTFGDFIREGNKKLQSLYRKTKRGLIAKYSPEDDTVSFISTKEGRGNYVSISNLDFFVWSRRKWKCYYLKHRWKLTRTLFNFKENVLDRVYEYFFGYYHNPVKRVFQFSNIAKLKRLTGNNKQKKDGE